MPDAIYEELQETVVAEIDETCDISLAYINHKNQNLITSDYNHQSSSLREFQQIEHSVNEETRSSHLDYSSRVLHGSA